MRSFFVTLLLVAGAASLAADSPAPSPELKLDACRLEHLSHLIAVAAECGTLKVLENPAAPHGRRIDLYVARVPAINRRKQPDALFVLAGGPGMAATTFYTSVEPLLQRIHRDRDIVLVDQRGTGGSNGLTCALDEDALWHATDVAVADQTRKCLQSLQSHADVAFYTTSLAVQDLEQVRAALGYAAIDLYGVSYGTRVAQHYMRRFPSRVRAAILDGVVPPQRALGASTALDAELALGRILERCTRDADCQARFGNPSLSYRALRNALAARPVEVSVPDPSSGQPLKFSFTPLHLAAVLRLSSYSADLAALLPLTLDLAQRQGNYAPLAAQFLLTNRSYEDAIAYGMHNTVVCSEDVPYYDTSQEAREQLSRTYLGTVQLDGLESVCAGWPRGPVDPDFHAPLKTTTPLLLLSGSDDPITPPEYARQVAHGLGAGVLNIEIPGMGHGQITAPCVDRVMARFIEAGTVTGLDVSCIQRVRPMPFFTSLAGPPP